MFEVAIARQFQARQGLRSPVRAAKGLPSLVPDDGFTVVLRVGITFKDSQLTERGWFVDTDAVETLLDRECEHLASSTWTELFEFRPTFEMVAKWLHGKLREEIPQLAYLELENTTINVTTRYGDS